MSKFPTCTSTCVHVCVYGSVCAQTVNLKFELTDVTCVNMNKLKCSLDQPISNIIASNPVSFPHFKSNDIYSKFPAVLQTAFYEHAR